MSKSFGILVAFFLKDALMYVAEVFRSIDSMTRSRPFECSQIACHAPGEAQLRNCCNAYNSAPPPQAGSNEEAGVNIWCNPKELNHLSDGHRWGQFGSRTASGARVTNQFPQNSGQLDNVPANVTEVERVMAELAEENAAQLEDKSEIVQNFQVLPGEEVVEIQAGSKKVRLFKPVVVERGMAELTEENAAKREDESEIVQNFQALLGEEAVEEIQAGSEEECLVQPVVVARGMVDIPVDYAARQEAEAEIVQNFQALPGEELVEEIISDMLAMDRNVALLNAAKEGHVQDVLRLLSEGADASYENESGYAPLHLAATEGHLEVARALIDAGASVNYTLTCSPLHVAAMHGHIDVVAALISAGSSVEGRDYYNETPLHYAVTGGHADCVTVLAAAGADLNVMETLSLLTPLHKAVQNNRDQCVRVLIDVGANIHVVNNFRETPLFFAYSPKIIIMLTRAGARVNARNGYGETPLHSAVRMCSVPCVRALLSFGADLGVRGDDGRKPIDVADDRAVKEFLLDRISLFQNMR